MSTTKNFSCWGNAHSHRSRLSVLMAVLPLLVPSLVAAEDNGWNLEDRQSLSDSIRVLEEQILEELVSSSPLLMEELDNASQHEELASAEDPESTLPEEAGQEDEAPVQPSPPPPAPVTAPSSSTQPPKELHTRKKQRDLDVSVAFLYWKTFTPNLYYAINQAAPLPTDPPGIGGDPLAVQKTMWGNLKTVSYDWDAGFRVEAGYLFGKQNRFGLHAVYTQFNNDGQADTNNANGQEPFLASTFSLVNAALSSGTPSLPASGLLSSASSSLELDYNAADLFFNYTWLSRRAVFSDFFVGGRTIWIDQNWNSQYTSQLPAPAFFVAYTGTPPVPNGFAAASFPISSTYKVNNYWSFTGGGPRLGMRGQVLFLRYCDVHAQLAGSLLYGTQKTKMKNSAINGFVAGRTSSSQHLWVPSYDFLLGLGGHYVAQQWALRVNVDWEITGFQDLQRIFLGALRQNPASLRAVMQHGNVTLQGLTAGITLEF